MKNSILCFIAVICFAAVLNAQNQSLSAQYELVKWKWYDKSNSPLFDDYITTIALDGKGDKWIANGRDNGIFKFDGTNWTSFNISNSGIQSNDIRSICADKNGHMWIGSYNHGLAKYDGSDWIRFIIPDSGFCTIGISEITIDSNGMVWIATYGGGLAKFDGSNWTVFNTKNSDIPSNFLYTVAIEVNGTVWVGTKDSGLAKFDGTSWTKYNSSNSGLPDNNVTAIEFDGQGIKWIGTENGFAKFNGVSWVSLYSFSEYYISKIIIDDSSKIWFVTYNHGLIKLDGMSWIKYENENPAWYANYYNTFVIDRYGTKWLASFSGLTVFNEYGIPSSVRDNFVSENNIRIFPNPVKDYLNIELPENFKNYKLEISDLQGKIFKIYDNENNQNATDIRELPNGIYLLKVITEKETVIKKFVKE